MKHFILPISLTVLMFIIATPRAHALFGHVAAGKKLNGTISGGSLRFTGHVVEQPNMKISFNGRKLADLE